MTNPDHDSEIRFIKLMLSAVLKTINALHADIDAHATVRQHMLNICAGVRQRALDSAQEGVPPEQATASVDRLVNMINEYIEYSDSPLFPDVELVPRGHD